MEDTLVNILKNVVNHPEDIRVEKEDYDFRTVKLTIFCNEEDKGMIIGKSGRTIKALNNIINIKGAKENKKAIVRID